MSESIRSFLAIDINAELLEKIKNVEDEFKQIDANIKYVNMKNMHLTLKFFGNIDLNMVDEISVKVKEVLNKYQPFDIYIKGSGAFPNAKRIKVIWIGLEEEQTLKKLQKDLDGEFNKLGFDLEKNYKSHLTIGRMKNAKNKNLIQEKLQDFKDYDIGNMTVSKIALKKSTLTPQGPIYEDIEVFEL
ncbi:RNA 2',3'-cyclic phosphodiesterase [uncultured Methanobrevibacter sp.]|uniref:RNA 2',3'-cyclic phosphodiesterase n=1 Tax=uncultured Methanobrevibacter sp. TaxID=253161 RepID=UPI0025E41C0B|nr:RNA 2',3'-cyclic phosphodiesterase [uncultured Methanobrevibacter sp.]